MSVKDMRMRVQCSLSNNSKDMDVLPFLTLTKEYLMMYFETREELIEAILERWPLTNIEFLADCSKSELVTYLNK